MSLDFSQEQREKLIFKIAESLQFSSDEYLIELLENVSVDYAKGYLDGFLAKAKHEEILLFYQIVRTINMV